MITGDQIVVHAIGDYLLQSDWMADQKTKRHVAAFAHALVYSLPFLLFRPSLVAWLVIFGTHFLIDRYRLARYVVYAKNFLAPRWLNVPIGRPGIWERNRPWSECSATGYPSDRPVWLAVWLMIFADNILHIVINGAALRFL